MHVSLIASPVSLYSTWFKRPAKSTPSLRPMMTLWRATFTLTGWVSDDEEEEEWELLPRTDSHMQHDMPVQLPAPEQHAEPAGIIAEVPRVPAAERDLSDIRGSWSWLPRGRAAKFGLRRMSRVEDETLVEQLWQRAYRVGAPRHWKLHDSPEEPEMEAAVLEEHARETEHAAREAQETARVLREEAERQAFIESVPQGLTLEGLGVLRWECYSRQHSQVHQMLSNPLSLPPFPSCNSIVKCCMVLRFLTAIDVWQSVMQSQARRTEIDIELTSTLLLLSLGYSESFLSAIKDPTRLLAATSRVTGSRWRPKNSNLNVQNSNVSAARHRPVH